MKTQTLVLTAAALLMVAGAAVPAQQSTQPRDATRPQQPGATQPGQQPPRQPAQQPGRAQQPGQTQVAATGVQLIPSEWVIDADVENAQGDDLGSVEDLVVDASNGRITHGVLSHGGVLGVGAKTIAVPWRSFQWNQEDRKLILPMTEQQLEQAPEFNPDQLGQLGGADQPGRAMGFGVQDNAADADDGWGVQSQYQNLLRNGQQATISGSVTNIERRAPLQGMNEGIVITISEAGGEEMQVHLGPAWFIDRQDVMLRLGDQVQVEGLRAQVQDREAVIAKNLTSPHGTYRLRDEQNNPIWDATRGQGGAQQPGQQPQRPGTQQPGQPQQRQQPDQPRPGAQPPSALRPGQQPAAQPAQQPQRPGTQQPSQQTGQQPGRGVPDDEPFGDNQQARQQQRPGAQGGKNLVLVTDLNDQTVSTMGQEDLGEVEDLVFDALSGQAAFIVVNAGAFLGGGDDAYVALPWNLVRVEQNGRIVANQIDRDRLQAAPKIEDTDEWNQLEDPMFGQRVYQHFGVPYPFQQGARQPGMQQQPRQPGAQQPQQPGQQPGQAQQGAQAQQRYIQLFTSGQQANVTGTIQNVQQAAPMQGMEPLTVLTIETPQGQKTVHLAPQQYLQQNNITAKQGDQLTIEGRTANIEGRQVVIASKVQSNGQNVNLRGADGKPAWQSAQPPR